jgi:hypothetical protein
VAVVQEPIDQRGGHDFVAEDLAPLLEALVRGERGGSALIAPGDHLEEEHRAGTGDRQVADFVDHEDGRVRKHLHPLGELPRGLRFLEVGDQVGERAVVDAAFVRSLEVFGRRPRKSPLPFEPITRRPSGGRWQGCVTI